MQRYFIDSWLSPCSLRSHRTANSTPKNGLRHFSALPTHHPNTNEQQKECAVLKLLQVSGVQRSKTIK